MSEFEVRPGELCLAPDTIEGAQGARVIFIGRVRTPWTTPDVCPKNLRQAREQGGGAEIEVDAAYRPGLKDLGDFSHAIVLYWMDRSRRDIIVQRPRGADEPRGVFAVRSPLRPNPIGLAVVRLVTCDVQEGRIAIDAIDCLDGTPLLDIKPYLASIDAMPGATGRERVP